MSKTVRALTEPGKYTHKRVDFIQAIYAFYSLGEDKTIAQQSTTNAFAMIEDVISEVHVILTFSPWPINYISHE